jgi:hypothetical protein
LLRFARDCFVSLATFGFASLRLFFLKHLSENILTFFNAKPALERSEGSQWCKDAKKDSPEITGVRGLSATLRLCVLALKNKRNFLKVA